MAWRKDLSPEERFIETAVRQVRFWPDRKAIAEELRQHLMESAAWLEEEAQMSLAEDLMAETEMALRRLKS